MSVNLNRDQECITRKEFNKYDELISGLLAAYEDNHVTREEYGTALKDVYEEYKGIVDDLKDINLSFKELADLDREKFETIIDNETDITKTILKYNKRIEKNERNIIICYVLIGVLAFANILLFLVNTGVL